MGTIFKNLIALFGVILFSIGSANAAISLDCGDDDSKPITVHTAAEAIGKDS